MSKKPKVLVIMSTYNGEKFLNVQIDSVLAQQDVDVTLHIFDDCSKDRTQEIVKEYEKKHKNVILHINEKNKNFTYNFIDGLFTFKDEQKYDYYSFADQDDYWLPNKLISAINKIREVGECTLYSSNLKIVDQNLNYFGQNMADKKYKQGHYDILYGNVVTGCTIVFDNKFKNLATKYYPENIYLHDYWLALISHYCKEASFVYDFNPDGILYRQHGANLIGSNKGGRLKKLVKKLFEKKDYQKSTQNLVNVFWKLYQNEIADNDKIIIQKTAEINKIKNRIYLIRKVKTFHPRGYFMKVLLNKY